MQEQCNNGTLAAFYDLLGNEDIKFPVMLFENKTPAFAQSLFLNLNDFFTPSDSLLKRTALTGNQGYEISEFY